MLLMPTSRPSSKSSFLTSTTTATSLPGRIPSEPAVASNVLEMCTNCLPMGCNPLARMLVTAASTVPW